MTGCRHGAKNDSDHELPRAGRIARAPQVHPLTTVTGVRPLPGGGYAVDTERTGSVLARRSRRTFTADQVVFSAGTYNTQKLLHQLRATSLPGISPRLGWLTRTNSEALLGVRIPKPEADYTSGRGHHLVVASGPGHAHRAGALRQGQQRDGAAEHRHDRRRQPPATAGRSSCSRCQATRC